MAFADPHPISNGRPASAIKASETEGQFPSKKRRLKRDRRRIRIFEPGPSPRA
jgi:hypothetical protein